MTISACDVAIVGAGPYGLAAAAHLRAANGLELRVLGEPMAFWRHQMPTGMMLRSPYIASHIADPEQSLTLDSYQAANSNPLTEPVPLDRFVEYGQWFQRQVAPDVDSRQVVSVDRDGAGFRLALEDGQSLEAARVIVAAGIAPFAWIPGEFRRLPEQLASHSSAHPDLGRFADRRVIVIGAGQSALESAALLHEAGADVEVIARASQVYFLRRIPWLHQLGPLTRLAFAPAEVGPAGVSRLVSAPGWYRRLPRSLQDRFSVRSLRPAGAAWLVPRLAGVPVTTARRVVSTRPHGLGVELMLDDDTTRFAHHVLLATGYRVDIARYTFLSTDLVEQIDRIEGYPRLSWGFESSVPGLYFVGAAAAWSFGPLMRFVAGTEYAAPALVRGILGRGRRAAA